MQYVQTYSNRQEKPYHYGDGAFPDLATLDSTASAIGSNMFEGFEPTEKLIQLYLTLIMLIPTLKQVC